MAPVTFAMETHAALGLALSLIALLAATRSLWTQRRMAVMLQPSITAWGVRQGRNGYRGNDANIGKGHIL